MLSQIVAGKAVVATVQDPEKRESLSVHGDRLDFRTPRLRAELAL